MELTCPLCFRSTAIHEHQVFTGNRFSCHRCGSMLMIVSASPFRVAPEEGFEKPPVGAGSGTGKKEEQNG